MAKQEGSLQASEEQMVYANLLEKGMMGGFCLLVITFAIYVLGILPSVVPLSEISGYWNQPVGKYLEAVNNNFLHWPYPPTGWAWAKLLNKGDFLNFVGVAILSGVTMMCYLAIVPTLLRKKDTAYVVMALLEAAILALAASGLLTAGGH